jgi:selenocysteine lyase/cysteine desulfurase
VTNANGQRTAAFDVDALRASEFPWAARGEAIYLNNASTGPIPVRTRAAVDAFSDARGAPYRLTDTMQMDILHRARARCAQLIGTRPSCIALMVNTTYGINLAARALPLRAGDTVVISDREFPANVYPWMMLARQGIQLRRVPCAGRLPDEDALIRALDEPGVRVLSVSWVSFATGYRMDLARLGAACRERGIYFVVDAIQGVGPLTLNVESLPIDVLACGGQKWLLSPWGAGFVYVREALVTQLEPQAVGWMAFRASEDFSRLVDYDPTLFEDARRFEVVTLPYQDVAGFVASLELILELGPRAVAAYAASLADRIVAWASGRPDVGLITPADPAHRAAIVSVLVNDAPGAAARLKRAGIVCALREGAIRLSPHCHNTAADVDRALEVLEGAS